MCIDEYVIAGLCWSELVAATVRQTDRDMVMGSAVESDYIDLTWPRKSLFNL